MNIAAFKEFLQLINQVYQLDNSKLAKLETIYQALYQDSNDFKRMIKDELNMDMELNDNLIDKSHLLFMILDEVFPCYFDDWRFYCEDLSSYISQYTDTPFVITDEEYAGDMDNLYQKLESQTPFSLLHIYSGSDDVHFYLINKIDKLKAIDLAKKLDIWID